MYQTADECRQAWEKAGAHGSKEDRIKRNAKWAKYYRYLAEPQKSIKASFDPNAEDIACHLRDAGILHDNATLLDIGSGTGVYSLPLAKRCAEVTALDMDDMSLSVLAEHAGKLGQSNINCIHGMWETYEPHRKFSVTFSSMCPAICTHEELLKMESMTGETCCLVAVTRGSYDLHRKNLMQLMPVKPKGGMTTEALWYYEMLYLMGRQPDVKNWTLHYEYDLPVAEACRRNEIYFEIFDIPREESRPVLKQYFNARAKNGIVHDESRLNLALICWDIRSGGLL